MSKTIKSVASIALPIVGSIFGGPIGGMIGGAAGGLLGGGGITGAITGGAMGYAAGGSSILGTAAHTVPAGVYGPQTYGSGIMGMLTGGGTRALASGVTSAVSDPTRLLLGLGGMAASNQAAGAQVDAAKSGIAFQKKSLAEMRALEQPYVQAGYDAQNQINTINADPAGYIQNNPLYSSLANDAQARLLSNQAAKGKIGSGGTASALQEQLLNIGNGLVQQQLGTLQNSVNTGANAAAGVGSGILNTGANVADLRTQAGNAQAGGIIGGYNAANNSYQNNINTLLALQSLNRQPVYAPNLSL